MDLGGKNMSTITIINNTKENIRIAVFKKPCKYPDAPVIAWHLALLPRDGGNTNMTIPEDYGVFAGYNFSEGNGDTGLEDRTKTIDFSEVTARFMVESDSSQGKNIAVIRRSYDELVENEIRIENQFNAEHSHKLQGMCK